MDLAPVRLPKPYLTINLEIDNTIEMSGLGFTKHVSLSLVFSVSLFQLEILKILRFSKSFSQSSAFSFVESLLGLLCMSWRNTELRSK